ncbi:hypothetical protein A9P82_09505 [Arachidicoccus ginsenosidimutans]|nr:hypothetical protein A9P82_09505 [Arachidicoccus sp. BS20]
MTKKSLLLCMATILMVTVFGQKQQDTSKVVADKIIGQIGSDIILKSELDGDLLQQRAAGNQNVADCELLKYQIIQKALAIQAKTVDSLPVDDDQIESEFQRRVNYFIQYYGSREKAEQVFGMTIDQFRQSTWQDMKNQILAGQEQAKITQNVTVSPEEVRAYFNAIPKDSLKYFESQYTASQIVMYPIPNNDVVNFIKGQLEDWKKQVESGKANFADLARIYSEDPSVKQNGGLMTINRIDDKGTLDPDFFNAVFRLREGQISPVIKTQFGYHIIQMVSRVGNTATIRHILKKPPVTQVEIDECIKRMDSLRGLLTDKKLDFAVAFNMYNEDKNAKYNAGAITGGYPNNPISPFTIDQLLDKDVEKVIGTLNPGEYSAPQIFTDPSTQRQAVRIIYLQTRTKPHRENLNDDYIEIQEQALMQKKQRVTEDWLTNHMQDFYIRLDPAYSHCTEIAKWVQNSNERVEHFSSTKIR